MEPTEKIELRRIYPKNAAIFGIVFSPIVAILFGLVILISGTLFSGGIIIGTLQITDLPSIFTLAGVVAVTVFVMVFLSIFVGAMIYNWLGQRGIMLHLGLAESEEEPEENKRKN